MKNKGLIASICLLMSFIVVAALIHVLSYTDEISTRAQSDYTHENNIHEVQLDYSLRTKNYQSFPFEVDKDKVLKIRYTFDSTDNTVKVVIREAVTQKAISYFIIRDKNGLEKVQLSKGQYTMNFIVPSLSQGSVLINWAE